MGQSVETPALARAIADTLETFLPDHPGCEEAEITVQHLAGETWIYVNGVLFRLLLEPPPAL